MCVGVSAPIDKLIGKFLAGDSVAAVYRISIQIDLSLYIVLSSVDRQNITVFITVILLSSAVFKLIIPQSTALSAKSIQRYITILDISLTISL